MEREEAIESVRKLYNESLFLKKDKEAMITLIPELAESKDERIRKEIIDFAIKANNGVTSILANSYNFNKWIAWLGKQGEQKPVIIIPKFRVGDTIRIKNSNAEYTITEISDGYYRGKGWCLDIVAGDGCGDYELVEQNPTDKVEPKFHEGDWVILTAGELSTTLQIVKVDTNKKLYWFNDSSYLPIVDEECLHFWTIQDAKDGDVLCTKNKCCPFIYDKGRYNNGLAYYYAGIDVCGNLNIKSPHNMLVHFGRLDNIRPATQEQRDLLFKKMKEAGCEWNTEHKQLKKIEQEPVKVPKFKVGDFIQFNGMGHTRYTVKEVCGLSHYINTCNKRMDMSYTDANFELLEHKPAEWSEEDKKLIDDTCHLINTLASGYGEKVTEPITFSGTQMIASIKDRLRALVDNRPRSHWRPSENQMTMLRAIINEPNNIGSESCHLAMKSLYDDLSKLK